MTFNIGVIIGPILGGILSDPAGSYPYLFGDVEFFRRFPYATPNLLSAFFLSCAVLSVWLFVEEASNIVAAGILRLWNCPADTRHRPWSHDWINAIGGWS